MHRGKENHFCALTVSYSTQLNSCLERHEIQVENLVADNKLNDYKKMSKEDWNRLRESPDYAFIANTASILIIKQELKSLVDLGGCYYEILTRYKADKGVITEDTETVLVALFFDDPIIDVKAEVMKIRSELR